MKGFLNRLSLPVFLEPSALPHSCVSYVVLLQCGKENIHGKAVSSVLAINFFSSNFSRSTNFAGKVFLEAKNITELW